MGVMNMKKLALILTLLFVVSCSPKSSTKKAVYFFQKQAQLSSEDLQAYPEVIVVQTFDEFKKYANQKVAPWIDKSATPLNSEQEEWINEAPVEIKAETISENSVKVNITGLVPLEPVMVVLYSDAHGQSKRIECCPGEIANENGDYEFSTGLRGQDKDVEFKDW